MLSWMRQHPLPTETPLLLDNLQMCKQGCKALKVLRLQTWQTPLQTDPLLTKLQHHHHLQDHLLQVVGQLLLSLPDLLEKLLLKLSHKLLQKLSLATAISVMEGQLPEDFQTLPGSVEKLKRLYLQLSLSACL